MLDAILGQKFDCNIVMLLLVTTYLSIGYPHKRVTWTSLYGHSCFHASDGFEIEYEYNYVMLK